MEAASSRPAAANDRCTVRRATPFHNTHLTAVLEAATLEQVSALAQFDAADLLTDQHVFLAYAGERPIGCIMAMPGATTVLHGLFVVSAERGKGHGSELIRSAISAFETMGATRSYWTAVDPGLPGAHERFLKFGFEIVPELCEERLQLMVLSASRRQQASTARLHAPAGVGKIGSTALSVSAA